MSGKTLGQYLLEHFTCMLAAVGLTRIPSPLTSPFHDPKDPFWEAKVLESFDQEVHDELNDRMFAGASRCVDDTLWIYNAVAALQTLKIDENTTIEDLFFWLNSVTVPR